MIRRRIRFNVDIDILAETEELYWERYNLIKHMLRWFLSSRSELTLGRDQLTKVTEGVDAHMGVILKEEITA